jgi:hypothetical protein
VTQFPEFFEFSRKRNCTKISISMSGLKGKRRCFAANHDLDESQGGVTVRRDGGVSRQTSRKVNMTKGEKLAA